MSKINITRIQEAELPASVDVVFINKDSDYQQGSQKAKRLSVTTEDTVTVTLPIVLSDTEAKNIAEILLYSAWVERNRYKFTLGPKYYYLEPSDVIQLYDEPSNATHTIRITRKTESKDGKLQFEAVGENSSIYTQNLTTGSVSNQSIYSIPPGSTLGYLLNIPILRDSDNANPYNIYVAATGASSGWKNCVIYKSPDNGSSYYSNGFIEGPTFIGNTSNILAPNTSNTWDFINSITIFPISNKVLLESTTEDSIYSGANTILIGNELIQFKTVVLNIDGSYTLRDLLRGRKGTIQYANYHYIGEPCILMQTSTVTIPKGISQITAPSGDLNSLKYYKFVAPGTFIADASIVSFKHIGSMLRPYPPCLIVGTPQSNSDWYIRWERRDRLQNEWVDGIDVPLSETSASFDILILSSIKNISNIFASSNITNIYSYSHGLSNGNNIIIVGTNGAKSLQFNTYSITVVDSNNITIPVDYTTIDPYISGGSMYKVYRTATVGSTSYTYTSANQITDFGSNQSSFNTAIFQNSGTVGRGWPRITTIS